MRASRAILCGWLAACGGDDGGDGGGDADAGSSTSGTEGGDGDGEGEGDGDGDGDPGECTLWEQDCPDEDTKCAPWSLAPDGTPDTTKCCPESADPKVPGDSCNVQDYDGSCVDDCERGSICVVDRPDSLEGICTQLCDPDAPTCEPDEVCKPFFEMLEDAAIVPLCMPECDPLAQDCDVQGRPGWTCLPDTIVDTRFICTPPPPGTPKTFLESCTLANECQPGLFCAPDAILEGCVSSSGFCCTYYCDLNENPDPCPQPLECTSFESPYPQWQHVGACVVPAGPGN
jgi:hypothetical protein